MTPKEVSENLRKIQVKYKNIVTPTFEICISDMAKDAADAIDTLQVFVACIGLLPTCNECANKDCGYRPGWGDTVRYNCPHYIHPHEKGVARNEK